MQILYILRENFRFNKYMLYQLLEISLWVTLKSVGLMYHIGSFSYNLFTRKRIKDIKISCDKAVQTMCGEFYSVEL